MSSIHCRTGISSKNHASSYLAENISNLGTKIYELWFRANKWLVEDLKQNSSPILGVSLGMVLLEGHSLCKAAWYSLEKYAKEPREYGFEQLGEKHRGKNPVLLVHGAAGSWNYLGDLASKLSKANIPVFVINLGGGEATEAKRKMVFEKIQQIRSQYSKKLKTSMPKVDLVAHSMGGNLALYSSFTSRCSFINENGELKFRKGFSPAPHSDVGKIVTLALPSNAEEVGWMRRAGKLKDLFNINAKYDALMGHKSCALTGRYQSQAAEINAGHIGIVFQSATSEKVKSILLRR